MAGRPTRVFPVRTNDVLVLDDGYDGVVVVDLDRRVAVRRVLPGQRPGDQPVRLAKVNRSLVWGWGEVWSTPIGTYAPRRIGDATIFIPGVNEGDVVWTLDYPGDRAGVGRPRLRKVTTTGKVLLDVPGPPADKTAVAAVVGGLAMDAPHDVVLWDAKRQRVTKRFGETRGIVHDSAPADGGSKIAWCDWYCETLHITAGDAPDVIVRAPDRGRFVMARFGGGELAAVVDFGRTRPESLVLIERNGGYREVARGTGISDLVWDEYGQRLYFSDYGGATYQKQLRLGLYDLDTRRLHKTTLAFFGRSMVALFRGEGAIKTLLRAPLGPRRACSVPRELPSGRTDPCAFKF